MGAKGHFGGGGALALCVYICVNKDKHHMNSGVPVSLVTWMNSPPPTLQVSALHPISLREEFRIKMSPPPLDLGALTAGPRFKRSLCLCPGSP